LAREAKTGIDETGGRIFKKDGKRIDRVAGRESNAFPFARR